MKIKLILLFSSLFLLTQLSADARDFLKVGSVKYTAVRPPVTSNADELGQVFAVSFEGSKSTKNISATFLFDRVKNDIVQGAEFDVLAFNVNAIPGDVGGVGLVFSETKPNIRTGAIKSLSSSEASKSTGKVKILSVNEDTFTFSFNLFLEDIILTTTIPTDVNPVKDPELVTSKVSGKITASFEGIQASE